MSLQFNVKPKAMEAVAKQLRLLSWAVGGIITAAGYQLSSVWVLVTSSVIWAALQGVAFVLECYEDEVNERSKL